MNTNRRATRPYAPRGETAADGCAPTAVRHSHLSRATTPPRDRDQLEGARASSFFFRLTELTMLAILLGCMSGVAWIGVIMALVILGGCPC